MKKFLRKCILSVTTCAVLTVTASSFPVNAAWYTRLLPDYSWSYQGEANICWACTITTMYNYEYGTNMPKEFVIGRRLSLFPNNPDYNNYPACGISFDDAYSVINNLFPTYSTHQYNAPLSQVDIMSQIINGHPAYIRGTGYDGSGNYVGGHAVALVGYKKLLDDGDIYRIYYMNPQHKVYDPNTGQLEQYPDYFESYNYSEAYGIYKFRSSSLLVTFDWEDTITLS